MTIEQVLADHRATLLALSGVLGVAQGLCNGQPCIRVFVADAVNPQLLNIPPQLEGFPVQVERTPPFEARQA